MVPYQILGSNPSSCLGYDLAPMGDAIYEASLAGDYGWAPADQVMSRRMECLHQVSECTLIFGTLRENTFLAVDL